MLPATFFSHGSDVIQDKDTPGKHRGKCKPTSSIPSLDPDVFMPILDATNLTELRNAACDTLKHCLPNVERAHVFLTNPENQQVEADGIILPKRGFAWDAFRQKSRQLCSVPFDPDPFIDLLALHSTDVQKVLLAPVPARRKDSNIGIIVASVTSVDLTASEDKYMELLLKQISVSYESMKLFMSEPATENSQLESLIALCADLHDQDAAQLELKVIKYVSLLEGGKILSPH